MIDHVLINLNDVVRPREAIGNGVHFMNSHEAANIIPCIAIIDFEINGAECFRRDNLGTDIHVSKDSTELN